MSSTVGFQTLLWRKRLVVVGSSHLDVAADSHDFGELDDLADREWEPWKESTLAWLLNRYFCPYSLFQEGDWLARYIERMPLPDTPPSLAPFAPIGPADKLIDLLSGDAHRWDAPLFSQQRLPHMARFAAYAAAPGEDFDARRAIRGLSHIRSATTSSCRIELPETSHPADRLRLDLVLPVGVWLIEMLRVVDPAGNMLVDLLELAPVDWSSGMLTARDREGLAVGIFDEQAFLAYKTTLEVTSKPPALEIRFRAVSAQRLHVTSTSREPDAPAIPDTSYRLEFISTPDGHDGIRACSLESPTGTLRSTAGRVLVSGWVLPLDPQARVSVVVTTTDLAPVIRKPNVMRPDVVEAYALGTGNRWTNCGFGFEAAVVGSTEIAISVGERTIPWARLVPEDAEDST